MKKIFLFSIVFIFIIAILQLNVFAETTTVTATSTINEVTVNWKYEVNDNGEIINLKCTNPEDLVGNITIPATIDSKSVVSIKDSGFEGAINITGVTLPDSVKEVSCSAFENCDNLENVNLGKLEKIGFNVFKNCPKLKTITIPKTLKYGTITDGVFTGTTELTSVTLENGMETVAEGLLRGCSGITEITIPETVKTIDMHAFDGTGITEIEMPESVKEISSYAFANCTNLKKITILENCTKIGLYTIMPNQDSVFGNHNEDLTIYCYKDSIAHQYAVSNNIKFELLTKPTTPINEEQNDNEDPKENEEKKDEVKTDDTKKTDKTVANKDLSNTGNSPIILYAIGVVILMGTVGVIYLRKYRKI